ncbi:hypothetical protein ACP70R_019949 [Stipagrostis hirtigluma subsp. patula]
MAKQEDLLCSLLEEGRPPPPAATGGGDDDALRRKKRHYAWRNALRCFFGCCGLAIAVFVLATQLPCRNTEQAMAVVFELLLALVAASYGYIFTADWDQIPY